MYKHYQHNLKKAVRNSSGRQKGLLVANDKAGRHMYGAKELTVKELLDIKDSVRSDVERQRYNEIQYTGELMGLYVSDIQRRYQRLCEALAALHGLFTLFKQHRGFEVLLNYVAGGKGKHKTALRESVVSCSRYVLSGEIRLRKDLDRVEIVVSDPAKKYALELIDAIKKQTVELKTMMTVAQDFMEENVIHLRAYEEYLAGIKGELPDLIRLAKRGLYPIDYEDWELCREILARNGDEHLALMEAVPDYAALSIDEDRYAQDWEFLAN